MNRPLLRNEITHYKIAYHLIDYSFRISRNLNREHGWCDISFLRYILYEYLLACTESKDKVINCLLKNAIFKTVHYYAKEFSKEFDKINFKEHKKILKAEICKCDDLNLKKIYNILNQEVDNSNLLDDFCLEFKKVELVY